MADLDNIVDDYDALAQKEMENAEAEIRAQKLEKDDEEEEKRRLYEANFANAGKEYKK